jgi:hypothetical protein
MDDTAVTQRAEPTKDAQYLLFVAYIPKDYLESSPLVSNKATHTT